MGVGVGGWVVIIQYKANSVLNWTCHLELSLPQRQDNEEVVCNFDIVM